MIFTRRGRPDQLQGMVLGGGAVPMPGATAPIFVPGCYIQGMAEALAAYITPQLIDPRVQGYCSFGGFLFDLQKATTGSLFPESTLYSALGRQVIEHFLGETMGASIAVGGFDQPAAMLQVGFRAAVDILAGARSFLGIGGYGDGFCPLAAVIQADLVRHFAKFIAGREFRREPGLTLSTVREGIADGSFLAHPTTLDYRRIYLIPELVFRHTDRKELLTAAREKARQIVAQHDYALPEDVRRDVAAVYDAACKDLLSSQ
jgi:trimethylamine:corrinoid methyltransferase-like protein